MSNNWEFSPATKRAIVKRMVTVGARVARAAAAVAASEESSTLAQGQSEIKPPRNKYYIWCIALSFIFIAMTLFEVISTILAFYALVRESDYANAYGGQNQGVTSEGVTRQLLTEDERHAVKMTIGAIVLVAFVELCFCVILIIGVFMAKSKYVLLFMSYVFIFAFFKSLSSFYKVQKMIQKKNIKEAANYFGVTMFLICVTILVNWIFYQYYKQIKLDEEYSATLLTLPNLHSNETGTTGKP